MSNQQRNGGSLPNQPEPAPSKPVPSTQATNPSPYPNTTPQPPRPATTVPSTQAQNQSPYGQQGKPQGYTQQQANQQRQQPQPIQQNQPQPEPSRNNIPPPSEVKTKPVDFSINSGIPGPLNPASGLLRPKNPVVANPNEPAVREKITRGFDVSTAAAGFAVAPVTAAKGALISPVISQGINVVEGKGLLSIPEVGKSMMQGAAFSVVAQGSMEGLGIAGKAGLAAATARVGVNTGLGAGAGYVLSGGQPQAAIRGAEFGFGFGVAGEVINYGGPKVKSYATERLSQSYEPTLHSGELWEPTVKEQILMKITGARPNSEYLQNRAQNILTESYDAQAKANIELIKTDGYRNIPFDVEPNLEVRAAMGQMEVQTESWQPTPKQAEMMQLVKVGPKPLPAQTVTAKAYLEDTMSFKGMKAGAYGEDAFDLAFAPKSTLKTEYVNPVTVDAQGMVRRLPVYFGLGQPYQTGYGNKAVFTEFKMNPEPKDRQPLEKGIPESVLDYDYQGPLSFKKPTAFEQISDIKPEGGGKMKPLGGSIGSKAPELEVASEPATYPYGSRVSLAPIERTSGGFSQLPQGGNVYDQELVTLSYPKSVIAQPQILSPTLSRQTETSIQMPRFFALTKNPQASNPLLLNAQVSQISKTRQDSFIIPATVQALEVGQESEAMIIPQFKPAVIQVPMPKQETTPFTDIPVIPKSGYTFPGLSSPGFKYEGNASDMFIPPNRSGLLSRKRLYPILLPEELFGLPKRRKGK